MEKKGQAVRYLESEDILKIRKYLFSNKYIVMLGLMDFALNTGLRISDIQNLKFEDITDNQIKIKTNNKIITIFLNKFCLKALENLKVYYKKLEISNAESGCIFKSQSQKNYNDDKAITYHGIIYYIRKIQKDVEIIYPFGTDSFRKTWGRIVYQETGNLYLVSNVFNHSNPTKTLNFIGFNDDCDYNYSLKNEILI